jgi:hypothetical protein
VDGSVIEDGLAASYPGDGNVGEEGATPLAGITGIGSGLIGPSALFEFPVGIDGDGDGTGSGAGNEGNSLVGTAGNPVGKAGIAGAGGAGIIGAEGTPAEGIGAGVVGVGCDVFGAGIIGVGNGIIGSSAEIGNSTLFFATLLTSVFGHWPATVASPPSETLRTPAIIFHRDHDMVYSHLETATGENRRHTHPRGCRLHTNSVREIAEL